MSVLKLLINKLEENPSLENFEETFQFCINFEYKTENEELQLISTVQQALERVRINTDLFSFFVDNQTIELLCKKFGKKVLELVKNQEWPNVINSIELTI